MTKPKKAKRTASTPDHEIVDLVMHENLLRDVIKKQAGSPQKALLEGVMNAIDAQAQNLRIDLDQNGVVLDDDGHGFESEETIRRCFRQFGAPHNEEERAIKTYGEFRMGRGQLFALGPNQWRTETFAMELDIDKMGLKYKFQKGLKPRKGCHIAIQFYRQLDTYDLVSIKRELAEAAKYVKGKVILNGELVSQNPDTIKWTETSEVAYYDLKSTDGHRGIRIYNLGVFVQELYSRDWGLCGAIVSRKRLEVNFARNEVLSQCPVFSEIKAHLKTKAKREVKKKINLTDADRSSIIKRILAKEEKLSDHYQTKLFVDVCGYGWSLANIARLHTNPSWQTTAENCIAYCFHEHSREGDGAIQGKRGIVLDKKVFQWFDYKGKPQDFFSHIGAEKYTSKLAYIPLHKMEKAIKNEFRILTRDELTQREQLILVTIGRQETHPILLALQDHGVEAIPRNIRIGIADGCDGWTDGKSVIAITRQFLKSLSTTEVDFGKLAGLLLHEYCHPDPDLETHDHDPAFFKLYHDTSDSIPETGHRLYLRYLHNILAKGKKLSFIQEIRIEKDKQREKIESRIVATDPMEEKLAPASRQDQPPSRQRPQKQHDPRQLDLLTTPDAPTKTA
jgi:hypothetical protein